jgi:predicted TIM-barrel fold metal-dependent hydrolase
LCFPTFPPFCGQTFYEAKDHELGLACIKAYNDWMVEEWCGDSGGRLIPLTIIPLWDAGLAAAEVERNAARGVRAVCFSEIPPHLGLPSIHSGYWDRFFATCAEADDVWREHRAWGGVMDIVPEPPSSYYYRQIFGCFFRDRHGIEALDRVGADNVTFETDYPHTDSTWPDSKRVAEELMTGVDDRDVYEIMRGNAIRMLGLDPD